MCFLIWVSGILNNVSTYITEKKLRYYRRRCISHTPSSNSKSLLYLCQCLSTTVNWHTTPTLSLSSRGVTDCTTTGTGSRETEFCFSLFTFALFFNLLKHMLSHKAGILSPNCSSCHTLACQETVGGHSRSYGCRCFYKYVFISTPQTTTSTMCHHPPLSLAELVNNCSSKIVLVIEKVH